MKGELQYKITRQVSVPTLHMAAAGTYLYRIELPVKYRAKSTEDGGTDRNIPVLRVTDLEVGVTGEVIPGKILLDTLLDQYPDDGYVGKCFEIIKKPSGRRGPGGREYNLFEVNEISVK